MVEKQRIKVTIADRVYPLTIPLDQEEGLRKAAKAIEGMIKKFEQSYAVRDKQDVLAMCALQFASRTMQQDIEGQNDQEKAIEQLSQLELLLKEHLT